MLGIILQITQTTGMVADTVQNVVQQVSAVNPVPAPTPTYEKFSLWELTLKGGPIMIPIALLSVIAVYIFIERFLAVRRANKDDSILMSSIRDFIHDGKLDAAKALCRNTQLPTARMLEKGISNLGKPLSDVRAAIENVGNMELSKLEKNIGYLAVCAGAAPMLGFLGTVTGMVKAFYNMSRAGNNIDISTLSSGIYEAMVTTVAGLIVGIIAYFMYNMIVINVRKVIDKMETRSIEFIDILNEPA